MKRELLSFLCLMLCSCTMTTSSGGERKLETPLDILREQWKSGTDTLSTVPHDLSKGGEPNPEDAYPKASDDANVVYELESNMERTQFFIDGKEMGIARRLKVKINNHEHTVTAKPEGCIAKEDFIRPPYISQAPLRFTFLIGECGRSSNAEGQPVQGQAPRRSRR